MFTVVGRAEVRSSNWALLSAVAYGVAAGVALGAVDLLAQRYVAYPWANLANSPAVWGLAGFLFGLGQLRPARGAAGSVVMLCTAVLAYYVVAAVVLGDEVANAFGGAAMYWYTGAVGVGAVAGFAGGWCRSCRRWQVALGAAFAPALLLAEASIEDAALLGTLTAGWLLATVLLVSKRWDWRTAIAVGVAVVPLAIVGHVAYLAVGLRGFGS